MSSLACDVSSYAAGSRNPTEMRPCSPVRKKPLMNFNCHTSNPITDDVEMNETVMCPFFASQLTLAFPCRNQRFEQLRPISCYVQLLRFKELTFGRKGADSFRRMLHRLASKRLTKCIAKTYFDFATRRTGGTTHTSEHPKGGRDGAEWRRFTTATSIKISEIFPLVLTSSRPRLSGSNVGRDPIKMRASCICSIYSRGAGKRKTDAHRHASSTRWSARTVDDDELGSLFLLPRSHTKNGGSTPLWHQSKQREGNNCGRIEIS